MTKCPMYFLKTNRFELGIWPGFLQDASSQRCSGQVHLGEGPGVRTRTGLGAAVEEQVWNTLLSPRLKRQCHLSVLPDFWAQQPPLDPTDVGNVPSWVSASDRLPSLSSLCRQTGCGVLRRHHITTERYKSQLSAGLSASWTAAICQRW